LKYPSKRAAAIAEALRLRDSAREGLRIAARAQQARPGESPVQGASSRLIEAELALASAEALPDTFTCIQCGTDFGDNVPAVDILIAAIIKRSTPEEKPLRLDFGFQRVIKGEAGRRLIWCGTCVAGWAHQPEDYVNLR
jgi:hypothetical protein